MTPDVPAAPASLWRGRLLALLGILLCAFSLRSAVASLSPLFDHIREDFAVSSGVAGLIGTAPPVCFALFGLLTPMLERRLGVERVTVIALLATAVGLVLRGTANDAPVLLATTALVFAGVGMANILLPPLVKKYFPDRLGVMMTLYTMTMSLSTFLPPLVAVPVADVTSWRFSLAVWGVFAIAGVIPWIVLIIGGRMPKDQPAPARPAADAVDLEVYDATADPVELSTGPIVISPASRGVLRRLLRLPLAWAIAIVFGTSSTIAYVSFAWLPTIVVDVAGTDAASAGLLLSLYAFLGLPASLVVPMLVVRWHATRPLYLGAVACAILGIVGLLLWSNPVTVWVWVAVLGMSGAMFPLALVLISIRARRHESAVGLSSFVQSGGYILAAAFPWLIGALHDATGGWTVPLCVLVALLALSVPFGIIAGRDRTVEDDWESRYGRW